jgi:hypothetical protein
MMMSNPSEDGWQAILGVMHIASRTSYKEKFYEVYNKGFDDVYNKGHNKGYNKGLKPLVGE